LRVERVARATRHDEEDLFLIGRFQPGAFHLTSVADHRFPVGVKKVRLRPCRELIGGRREGNASLNAMKSAL
jgi:hypothetical protein